MAEIHLLDEHTIDKIAAGEVVERPASVVKELIENAMDAGASAITAEIKEGGISFIRITDNGSGIEKKQVKKAFLRHATSKIKSVEDLLSISSLGFRGEALSSISAVSQVELITKTPDELTGVRYVIEGGAEKELEEIGAPDGTTVLVKNLFYNTPARRKFLKTAATEGSYISDLLEHLAMSRPQISFQFISNGQTKFHTSGNGDLKEIVYRIYGRDIAAQLIPISAEAEGIHLGGYLGSPVITRANRNYENYYINGRFIKSDLVSKAIETGYHTRLMQHKYPFTVLHLTILQENLDVNVHPAKMDIRFTNPSHFFDFISQEIEDCLKKQEIIPEVILTEQEKKTQDIDFAKKRQPEPFETKRKESSRVAEEHTYGEKTPKMQEILQKTVINKVLGEDRPDELPRNEKNHANIIKNGEMTAAQAPVQMDLFEQKFLTQATRKQYHILGQIFSTYWLIAYEEKLFIVDQHAAHEKVKYERLVQKIREKQVVSQTLNPPIIITLSGKEEEVLKEYTEYFQGMGFETECFGGNEYALRCVPADLYGNDEKTLFLEILDELESGALKGTPAVIEEKLASMACKAAVKGNKKMTSIEMDSLFSQLLELDNPYQCPHGRPTVISMSKYEIEKKFKRIL